MADYFVTGGTGFLGVNLVKYLLAKGHTVVSYSRGGMRSSAESKKIQYVRGDIRDLSAVKNAIHNCTFVVHTAAAVSSYPNDEIKTTNTEGMRNVLKAALENGIKRIVHISSMDVYGIPDGNQFTENDKLIGIGPYGTSKIESERICEEYRKEGLVITILRPPAIVGHGRRLGAYELFFEWASSGHNFPMVGNSRFQFLDIRDLCDAIYLCTNLDPEKVNDTFNIGAEKVTTTQEDLQAVLDYAGFGKRIIKFPTLLMLRFLLFLHLSPLRKEVIDRFAKDTYMSIEKAKNTLGFYPRYSNKEALISNYQWYLENKELFVDTGGFSTSAPWKQGILRLGKYFF
jgi:nucleoside-diphosphate-sugar epimerase